MAGSWGQNLQDNLNIAIQIIYNLAQLMGIDLGVDIPCGI